MQRYHILLLEHSSSVISTGWITFKMSVKIHPYLTECGTHYVEISNILLRTVDLIWRIHNTTVSHTFVGTFFISLVMRIVNVYVQSINTSIHGGVRYTCYYLIETPSITIGLHFLGPYHICYFRRFRFHNLSFFLTSLKAKSSILVGVRYPFQWTEKRYI